MTLHRRPWRDKFAVEVGQFFKQSTPMRTRCQAEFADWTLASKKRYDFPLESLDRFVTRPLLEHGERIQLLPAISRVAMFFLLQSAAARELQLTSKHLPG